MTVQINYKNNGLKNSKSNLILFVGENFNISSLKKHISNTEFLYISDLLKISNTKKNLLVFEISSKKRIVLLPIKKDIQTFEVENLGADLYKRIKHEKNNEYFLNTDTVISKIENFVGYFLHGLRLKSYEFNVYKSKKNTKKISINVIGNKNKVSIQNQL